MNPEQYAKTSEHSHQVALFIWAQQNQQIYPELKWMHAIHNQGHGDKVRGGKAKAEGVRAGVFDVFVPAARGIYHGLYIEMKAPGKIKDTSAVQDEFRAFADEQHYATCVCDSWWLARDRVIEYMGLL